MEREEAEAAVRFLPLERRVLDELAAAQGISLESSSREALTLAPYAPEPHK